MSNDELPTGTPVEKIGYELSYQGVIVRYETKYRTRWAVVQWRGKQFTDREYPSAICARQR